MNGGAGCPTTDQGLASRSGNCDLGAYAFDAIPLPTDVLVRGFQLGHKHFLPGHSIVTDAKLLPGSALILEAATATDFQVGFEVSAWWDSGSEIDIKINFELIPNPQLIAFESPYKLI